MTSQLSPPFVRDLSTVPMAFCLVCKPRASFFSRVDTGQDLALVSPFHFVYFQF